MLERSISTRTGGTAPSSALAVFRLIILILRIMLGRARTKGSGLYAADCVPRLLALRLEEPF